MASVKQLKEMYPYQSVSSLGVCKSCEEEVGMSPSHQDRGMTIKEARSLFMSSGRCQACMIKERDKHLINHGQRTP